MCGIFGAVAAQGTLDRNQAAFIRAAIITGQLRGEDGTGLILGTPRGDITTYKRAMSGSEFADCRLGRKASGKLSSSQLVIGHNRKTTSGGDLDSDCHPYTYDSLVGVHNGGIPHNVLSRLNVEGSVAAVDSAKLYAALSKADDPLDVLTKIHTGGYALAWVDRTNNSLCLARNDERPMWASSGDDGIYFASEPGMLYWLMSRYGLDSKDSKLYQLQPHVLYRVPMDNPAAIERSEYVAEKPPPVVHTQHRQPATEHGGWFNSRGAAKAYEYVTTTTALCRDFPLLSYYAGVIDDNIKVTQAEEEANGNVTNDKYLDMIVTDARPRHDNDTYIDVDGYVCDSTSSGIVVPILVTAAKDDGHGYVNRHKRCVKKDERFQVRVRVNSYKVIANGTFHACGTITTVWDKNANVKVTDDVRYADIEVSEARNTRTADLDRKELPEMWKKLRSKLT